MRKKGLALFVAFLIVGLTGGASAGHHESVVAFDATVSASDSSVLSNDGNAHYRGREVIAEIQDFPSGDTRKDELRFIPQQRRIITFQHPDVADGYQLACGFTGSLGFTSHSSGSAWWEEVQEQGSTTGDAYVVCAPSGSAKDPSYLVKYPGSPDDGGEGECVSFTKTGESTYLVSAEAYVPEGSEGSDPQEPNDPPTGVEPVDDLIEDDEGDPDTEPTPASGCPATIFERTWEQGGFVDTAIATEASAPFVLELTLR